MANKPRKKKYDYQAYPKADGLRVGCKVSWHYYKSLADAELCSVAARINAGIQSELGYDFGYCSPGEIRLINSSGWEYDGMYEVCLP